MKAVHLGLFLALKFRCLIRNEWQIEREGLKMDKKARKILLLEDDYESMHYLKEILEQDMKWEAVLTAEEGILSRLAVEAFDLIVVDIMIHASSKNQVGQEVKNIAFENVNWKTTGLEFLHRLRRGEYVKQAGKGTPADVPVIVLSAVAKDSGDIQTGQLLAQGYVEKPFRLDDLLSQFRRILQG